MGVSRVPPTNSIVADQAVTDIEGQSLLDHIYDELKIMNFYNQILTDNTITTEDIE